VRATKSPTFLRHGGEGFEGWDRGDCGTCQEFTCSVSSAPRAWILPLTWNFNIRDTSSLIFVRLRRQMLLKSVLAAFQAAVDEEERLLGPYLEVNQSRFDPEAIPARKRYLNRRVKLVQTLLKWRKHSGGNSGVENLVNHTLDVFIVPVADGGWEVGGEQCLRKVRLHTLL